MAILEIRIAFIYHFGLTKIQEKPRRKLESKKKKQYIFKQTKPHNILIRWCIVNKNGIKYVMKKKLRKHFDDVTEHS